MTGYKSRKFKLNRKAEKAKPAIERARKRALSIHRKIDLTQKYATGTSHRELEAEFGVNRGEIEEYIGKNELTSALLAKYRTAQAVIVNRLQIKAQETHERILAAIDKDVRAHEAQERILTPVELNAYCRTIAESQLKLFSQSRADDDNNKVQNTLNLFVAAMRAAEIQRTEMSLINPIV